MLKRPTLIALSAVFALTASLAFVASPARGANAAPALNAFEQAFGHTHDYTFQLRSHEVQGSTVQDRVYQYSFMKPHFAKTLIVSGPGSGSGGTWSGGDTVSGHQGGILSGIHLNVGLHDSRATSLLGYTIPDGLIQNIVALYRDTPGELTEGAAGKIDGQMTDMVELKPTHPLRNDVTRMTIYISRTTHWPLRNIFFSGSKAILDQSFLDVKTNVGLTQNDF